MDRAPEDHINIRILQTLLSGIPLILGLGTRMSAPYVDVVCWAPTGTGMITCRTNSQHPTSMWY